MYCIVALCVRNTIHHYDRHTHPNVFSAFVVEFSVAHHLVPDLSMMNLHRSFPRPSPLFVKCVFVLHGLSLCLLLFSDHRRPCSQLVRVVVVVVPHRHR
jgi:hypothetical protein